MKSTMSTRETVLAAAVLALLAVAIGGPQATQWANYHAFADQRTFWGTAHGMDVLSNLPFAVAGALGLWVLWRTPARVLDNVERAMAGLFFGGLLVVAVGSSAYHLDPNDAGLAVDRASMVLPFAGLLGLAAVSATSQRAGAALGIGAIALGLASVKAWALSGNVLPWTVFQAGGTLLLGWFWMLQGRADGFQVKWLGVLLAYGLAKLLEVGDHAIFEFTGALVSGHSLKHVVAACAACPVILALWRVGQPRQNAPGTGIAAAVAARRTSRA